MTKSAAGAVLAGLSVASFTAPASAGDLFGRHEQAGSVKDAPVEERKRLCDLSMNIGGTSDYVFRGISQSYEDPAVQGGVDATCGMFYAGVWASNIDFVRPGNNLAGDASVEVDLYAGIKPTWGPLTFDLGVIYYWYPGGNDGGGYNYGELDYVELKGGVSGTWNKFTLGGVLFWSPDYTGETGNTITLEGSAAYELPAIGPVTPTISALIGTTQFLDSGFSAGDYVYWNAGLSLGIDKFTLDFRYWDTDNSGICNGWDLCDSRFVFSAKVALP